MSLLPDWITGYDSTNADAAAAADAQLQTLNAADYAPGGKFYTPAAAAAVASDYSTQPTFGVAAQRSQIDAAFTDKLQSEANGLLGTPLGILWAEIKALVFALPWWVWAGAIVAVFLWLGGLGWVRKKGRLS